MTVNQAPAISASISGRSQNQLRTAMTIVWATALAKLVFHIYFNNRYGYFRDEFGRCVAQTRHCSALACCGSVHRTHPCPHFVAPIIFISYMKRLPFKLPVMEHAHMRAVLPQWYADQFGWNEIVAETAVAWNQLSQEERRDCRIFAQDYGQAGAIDFLDRSYGLPPALSGHQTWFLWGPRGYSGNCLIILDDRRERLEELFSNVRFVGTSADNRYALEREIPVFICRGRKFGTLADLWPSLQRWR